LDVRERKYVTGYWGKLHNEELQKLLEHYILHEAISQKKAIFITTAVRTSNPTSYTVRGIRSRSTLRVGHLARKGKIRNSYRILVDKFESKK
jgi:hypothetical protein